MMQTEVQQIQTARGLLIGLPLVHAGLCLASFLVHWRLFPVGEGLYFWWLAPFDAAALLAAPLFLSLATVGWGNLLNDVCGGFEIVALVYLGLLSLDDAPAREFLLALPVAARVAVGWAIMLLLRCGRGPEELRGCEA